MCEITRHNFEEKYSVIEEAFKQAAFVSLDCEFSALHIKNEYKGSLFDTPSQRYQLLRKNLQNAIPLEIGLTAFSFDRDHICYVAKPFKFYLFPMNFGLFDKVFICQTSGFHFLAEHKFDFNKVIYDGMPYLNKAEEKKIKKYMQNNEMHKLYKYFLNYMDEIDTDNVLVAISDWFYKKLDENELIVFDIGTIHRNILFKLHKDVQSRFPEEAWTYEENQQFKVRRVTPEEYKKLNTDSPFEENFLQTLLGLTKVFRLLVSLKKPLVAHNCLADLVLIINNFYNQIPQSYYTFKKTVNEFFPSVFDTKSISFELRKFLPEGKQWKTNGLSDLYYYFNAEVGRYLIPNSPRIEISPEFGLYTEDRFHDAGWDSYCTGYCFIRMAHVFTARSVQMYEYKFMNTEYLKIMEQFKNRVNIIRATTPYLNLSGDDPESERPPCLIIQSTTNKPLDILKITVLLREYGSVDVKPYSRGGRRAIVAAANYGSVNRILAHLQHRDDFKIVTYNSLKHSSTIRTALWTGAVAAGSILVWLLHSLIM